MPSSSQRPHANAFADQVIKFFLECQQRGHTKPNPDKPELGNYLNNLNRNVNMLRIYELLMGYGWCFATGTYVNTVDIDGAAICVPIGCGSPLNCNPIFTDNWPCQCSEQSKNYFFDPEYFDGLSPFPSLPNNSFDEDVVKKEVKSEISNTFDEKAEAAFPGKDGTFSKDKYGNVLHLLVEISELKELHKILRNSQKEDNNFPSFLINLFLLKKWIKKPEAITYKQVRKKFKQIITEKKAREAFVSKFQRWSDALPDTSLHSIFAIFDSLRNQPKYMEAKDFLPTREELQKILPTLVQPKSDKPENAKRIRRRKAAKKISPQPKT
ncbi:MAG: hypothetical protein ABW189_00995 [Rickettsiales bacterium]